jgi:peptidoglycan hydrolase-like protein with peptidoglycan-binding domain
MEELTGTTMSIYEEAESPFVDEIITDEDSPQDETDLLFEDPQAIFEDTYTDPEYLHTDDGSSTTELSAESFSIDHLTPDEFEDEHDVFDVSSHEYDQTERSEFSDEAFENSIAVINEISFPTLSQLKVRRQYVNELQLNTPIHAGSRNEADVRRVQEWLNVWVRGFPEKYKRVVRITGIYDAETDMAVRDFQSAVGLPPTGIVDEATWRQLCAPMANAFTKISGGNIRNLIVKYAQQHLKWNPRELPSNKGPWVRAYMNNSAGGEWCLAFVQTIIDQAFSTLGLDHTRKLVKSNYVPDLPRKHPKALVTNQQLLQNPSLAQPGDIMILKNPSGSNPSHTHATIVVAVDLKNKIIETIEGNTWRKSKDDQGLFRITRPFAAKPGKGIPELIKIDYESDFTSSEPAENVLAQPTTTPNTSSPVKFDIDKAIAANRMYSKSLGWENARYDIYQVLGFTNMSPNESLFAEAVADWQTTNGMKADGIIGPKTWQVLQTRFTSAPDNSAIWSLPTFPPAAATKPTTRTSGEVTVRHNVLYKYPVPGTSTTREQRGAEVKGIAVPSSSSLRNDDDIIVACMIEAEGGKFDSVNLYDIGILSWGIMQWTAHAGSLQKLMQFIRSKLASFSTTFGGLDINARGEFVYKGVEYPKGGDNLPLIRLFRGNSDLSYATYDRETAQRWSEIFAKAGRMPEIQRLQMDHTLNEMRQSFGSNLGKDLKSLLRAEASRTTKRYTPNIKLTLGSTEFDRPVLDYIGGDLKSKVLFFGMWTNNRVWSKIKLLDAIHSFMARRGLTQGDPAGWPGSWPADFGNEFEKVLRETRFKYWGVQVSKEANRESRTVKIMDHFKKLTGSR